MTIELKNDAWLGDILGTRAVKVVFPDRGEILHPSAREALKSLSREDEVFAYARVDADNEAAVRLLEDTGFRLMETGLNFSMPIEVATNPVGEAAARMAVPEDKDAVEAVARTSFSYSRFHRDPNVPDEKANEVKARWAGNFFHGKRGDHMVVAEVDGKVIGFLQLLERGENLVIDLIAVHESARRKGAAAAMTAFALKELKGFTGILVGTQAVNVPATRFYENMGFRFTGAVYVYHFHHNTSAGE